VEYRPNIARYFQVTNQGSSATQVSELATKNGQLHQNLDEVNRDRIKDLKTAVTQGDPRKATAEAREEEKSAQPLEKGAKVN
jgi:hypothetical protein